MKIKHSNSNSNSKAKPKKIKKYVTEWLCWWVVGGCMVEWVGVGFVLKDFWPKSKKKQFMVPLDVFGKSFGGIGVIDFVTKMHKALGDGEKDQKSSDL